MTDFCSECSVELFGEDFKQLTNLGNGKPLLPDYGWPALCEGCGPVLVDDCGKCLGKCLNKTHG